MPSLINKNDKPALPPQLPAGQRHVINTDIRKGVYEREGPPLQLFHTGPYSHASPSRAPIGPLMVFNHQISGTRGRGPLKASRGGNKLKLCSGLACTLSWKGLLATSKAIYQFCRCEGVSRRLLGEGAGQRGLVPVFPAWNPARL